MRSFESWMLGYLLNSLWQVPLLFAAAWLAARALRSCGAAVEHRVWVGALVLEAVLPGCSVQPWPWRFWAGGGGLDAGRVGEVSVVMGPGMGLGVLHLPAWLPGMAAVAYGALVVYFAARLTWGVWQAGAMRVDAQRVMPSGIAGICWARCCERFGIYDAELWTSPAIRGPLTMGIGRKLVLLPATMLGELQPEDLETVIAHEFAHMRRRDFVKNLGYELLSLPMVYHPLFWATRARVVESREMICDRMAAEAAAGPEQYARSLLRLASRLVERRTVKVAHAIGIFDANAFERRVMRLTGEQGEVKGVRRMVSVAACVAFGFVTCASALAVRAEVYSPLGQSQGQTGGAVAAARIPGGVMAGQLLSQVTPIYPAAAKQAKIQGAVVLHAIIGKDGTMEQVTVISGPAELQQSALEAVSQWVYKPYLLNGEPTEVDTTVEVNYQMF